MVQFDWFAILGYWSISHDLRSQDMQDIRSDIQDIRLDIQDIRLDIQDIRLDIQDIRSGYGFHRVTAVSSRY